MRGMYAVCGGRSMQHVPSRREICVDLTIMVGYRKRCGGGAGNAVGTAVESSGAVGVKGHHGGETATDILV